MEKIINIDELKNNIEKLSKTLPSLNIDSIYNRPVRQGY